MLGWEGRFEPVECVGKKVLVEPLKDLKPEDGFLLVVTLSDGKELPFTVTARNEQFDHQVNVFPDNETKGALKSRLTYAESRERVLEEENERFRKEASSIAMPLQHSWQDGSPGPQECPEEAIKAMRILNLRVGDGAVVDLYVNQALTSPITLYDGPVESMLSESLGPLAPATRLYGRVWTGGPQVVVRYYEAHPPDGELFPLCAVARLAPPPPEEEGGGVPTTPAPTRR